MTAHNRLIFGFERPVNRTGGYPAQEHGRYHHILLIFYAVTHERKREREAERGAERERQRERENSKSKAVILRDSSVRSIRTYLTASPCYTTNTNKHGNTTNKYYKHD